MWNDFLLTECGDIWFVHHACKVQGSGIFTCVCTGFQTCRFKPFFFFHLELWFTVTRAEPNEADFLASSRIAVPSVAKVHGPLCRSEERCSGLQSAVGCISFFFFFSICTHCICKLVPWLAEVSVLNLLLLEPVRWQCYEASFLVWIQVRWTNIAIVWAVVQRPVAVVAVFSCHCVPGVAACKGFANDPTFVLFYWSSLNWNAAW